MRSVRASGRPILAAKCEKSSPMAKVADVNTQAQGRDSTYSRKRSAISKGVNCSDNPLAAASIQRSPDSSDNSRNAASALAQLRRAARAIRGAGAAAQALELRGQITQRGLNERQRVQKGIRQIRPFNSVRRRAATRALSPRAAPRRSTPLRQRPVRESPLRSVPR